MLLYYLVICANKQLVSEAANFFILDWSRMSSCENSDSPKELGQELNKVEHRKLGCAALPPDVTGQYTSDVQFAEGHRRITDEPDDETGPDKDIDGLDAIEETVEAIDTAATTLDSEEESDDTQETTHKTEASPEAGEKTGEAQDRPKVSAEVVEEFGEFYGANLHNLVAYMAQRGVSDPESVAHGVFEETFRKLDRYTPGMDMRAFVMTCAKHRVIDNYRYAGRHKEDLDPDVGTLPATTKETAPSAESEALTVSLEERLSTLPESQVNPLFKGILLAIYRDGKQASEYAREIGANENTIRGYHSRALRVVEELAGAQPGMDKREKRAIVADFLGLHD